jgi:hypothetical protein
MAFCTSCGKEVTPGKKFCESCGTPVEQGPAVPAAQTPVQPPHQPLVTAPPPKKAIPVTWIAGIVVILLVIAAGGYFVGLPYLQKAGAGKTTTPQPTIVQVTQTLPPTMPEYTQAPTPIPTKVIRKLEGRYEESYDEIYTLNQFFAFGQKVDFDYDLTVPPLYVKYNLTPKLITREKTINIGLSTEQTINVTYANPNAWFEIKVLDANNGAVIDDQGYGKDFPDVTKSEFMVRNPGKYRIEFSGNDVTAEISVLKGTG